MSLGPRPRMDIKEGRPTASSDSLVHRYRHGDRHDMPEQGPNCTVDLGDFPPRRRSERHDLSEGAFLPVERDLHLHATTHHQQSYTHLMI